MMQEFSVKAILFDFDMTLVDSRVVGDLAIKDLYNKDGISSRGLTEKDVWSFTHEGLCRRLAEINNNRISWQEISRLNISCMKSHYRESRLNGLEFLMKAHEYGIKLGIVSSNSRWVIEEVLSNQYNSGIHFDLILGSEDLDGKASKKELIIKAVSRLHVPVEQALYVGDHPNDLIAAGNAGVIPVGITSGLYTAEELKTYNPAIVIGKIDELEMCMRNIQSRKKN